MAQAQPSRDGRMKLTNAAIVLLIVGAYVLAHWLYFR
jgi:hypothetical protein